jgi:hypothetical protein
MPKKRNERPSMVKAAVAKKEVLKRVRYGAVTDGCPPAPQPPSRMLAQTFSASELRDAGRDCRTGLIVHRGPLATVPGFRVVTTHVELGVVWSNRASSITSVSSRELRAALLGSGSNDCQIFCHAGWLNRRALRAALGLAEEVVPGRAGVHLLASYGELAEAGRVHPDALVLGLRGEDSVDSSLRIVSIDGWAPVDRRQCETYPFQYQVQCYLRDDLSSDLECAAMSHVEEIVRRVECDERILLAGNECESGVEGLAP